MPLRTIVLAAMICTLMSVHGAVRAAEEDSGTYWAFRPVERQQLPAVKDRDWPESRVDYFILARLESEQLAATPRASRRRLIRRLSFDLTGLPASPRRTERFVADPDPNGYEKLVDELLASPQFGERWARPWLDLARYAEDQAHIVGSNKSLFYPNAYLYRDWVIGAINDDLGYDQFVSLQLAADLMGRDDQLAALGFIGLGPKYYRRNDLAVMADEWEDRVDTVTRGLLGLTVACARCHDHKYDPIPTEDYYALAGVFASTEMFNAPLEVGGDKKTPTKDPDKAMHVVRDKQPRDLEVFIRGDVNQKGDPVARRFLTAINPSRSAFREGSGRGDLAAAIVATSNPLTARVFVNRVWSYYFGHGIVNTTSNFGNLGDKPTHPALLDDLADRFIKSGWSMKWLHRQIVLSSTYRQDSQASQSSLARDPENKFFGRMPRRRLDVEAWRDSLLIAAGRLRTEIGGESMPPDDPGSVKRTVYSEVSRFSLNPLLALFDFPDPNVHAATRAETTTPLQKLFVLNSPWTVELANAFGKRLAELPAESDRERLAHGYRLLFGRAPNPREAEVALQYLQDAGGTSLENWQNLGQVLLCFNEAMYLD